MGVTQSTTIQGWSWSCGRASFSKLNSQVKLDFPLSRFIQVELSGEQHVAENVDPHSSDQVAIHSVGVFA